MKAIETEWVLRIGVALVLAAVGCAEQGDADFDQETRGIHNGTAVSSNPYGVVAVYHRLEDTQTSAWYPRPCTGVVLNPSYTFDQLILTARHCVTPAANPNDGIDGPTLHGYGIKVSGELAPGPLLPDTAVQAYEVIAPPSPNGNYLELNETLDLAIVRVTQQIPGLSATTSTPLFMGSSGDLADQMLEMYGYGCFGYDDSASAGVLRHSTGHQIYDFDPTSPGHTGYDYNGYIFTAGANDAFVAHGDSGGPSFWTAPNSLQVQIGVHHTSSPTGNSNEDVAISRVTTQWIQQVALRVYIRPQDAMNRALTRSGSYDGASLKTAATANVGAPDIPNRQWFGYEFSTRHIVAPASVSGTTCLRRNTDNSLQMQTCSTSDRQKWWVGNDNTIGTSDGYCLQRQASTNLVAVVPCSSSDTSQKWYFDADSQLPGLY